MTAMSHEVVTMFEEAGLTIEQIADDTGFDIASVKANLLQFSKVYRDITKKTDSENAKPSELITEDELKEALEVIKSLSRYAENEAIRGKMACRIIDEKMGRLDMVKEVRSANFNIVLYNQQLLANRRAKEKVTELICESSAA